MKPTTFLLFASAPLALTLHFHIPAGGYTFTLPTMPEPRDNDARPPMCDTIASLRGPLSHFASDVNLDGLSESDQTAAVMAWIDDNIPCSDETWQQETCTLQGVLKESVRQIGAETSVELAVGYGGADKVLEEEFGCLVA